MNLNKNKFHIHSICFEIAAVKGYEIIHAVS